MYKRQVPGMGFHFLICKIHLRFAQHYVLGTVLSPRAVKLGNTQALL